MTGRQNTRSPSPSRFHSSPEAGRSRAPDAEYSPGAGGSAGGGASHCRTPTRDKIRSRLKDERGSLRART
jgi:hypothetical protein